MADLDGTPGVGETHRRTQKYRDDGDGTKSTVNAANLWGWDNTTGAWSKLLVDHATGFLAVASSGGGGTVSIAANQSVINAPSTSGGITVASGSIGNAATAVKAGAGQVYGYHFYNNNPTQSYVQFYNLSTTNTSVGTAPTASLGIPANSGAAVQFDIGWAFSTAITIAICTTRGGSTSPTNTVDFNVFYD